VVAISRVVQNAVLSALGCTVERLIYNGVVFNSLYKKINTKSSDKPFGLRLVSVGRLDKHKCMDKLIMAVSLLKSDITNIYLQIIGDGEQKPLLQSMIKQLDLEKHVELLGWQEEPGLYLHQCDLYVCVSSFEGFGLALVEAMLSNLPVLTTKVGIAIEIIKDEDNGFFIENCEPSIIAKKINYINKCHDLAFRVARKGHELVKNNFEITKCADNYMNLYLLKMVEYNE
jgi:glycosyltransferase involved in cell wall biosynthesis